MAATEERARVEVVDHLRDALVGGQFAHGDKLRPEALKTALGCSPSTVREALFRLSAEGLVEFQEQRGFRVPGMSPEALHDITRMRIWLEEQGARLSVRQGGVDWEARLTAAHHKLSHIESRVERAEPGDAVFRLWVAGEQEFHQTLISNCDSPLLKATHLQIYRRFRQQMVGIDRSFFDLPVNREQHGAILAAALDGDEETLAACIHAHLGRHLLTRR